ncbi:MAG: SUMF1/EgtB/PvdO family nonheme iron enzyme [Chloroflexi bacterium]|nr:SUMF1/EgtB/PvdO family nonheme iron enzyme [Chloroflexota bacterium]
MTPEEIQRQIELLQQQLQALQGTNVQVGNDMVGRDKIGRDQYNIQGNVYYGEPTDDPTEALRIYREVVLNESNRLGLDGLDVSAADPTSSARPLRLAAVYVTLHTTSQQTIAHGSQGDDSEESLPITALGACGQERQLVLTGDPGGGKSTFVNHLAHALCAHQLERAGDWHAQLTPEYNSLRPAQLTLLPLKLILRDFAAMLPTTPAEVAEYKRRTTPLNALTQFVAAQLQRQNLGFVEKPLSAELQAGRVWLLLDGLDEVTNPSQRQFVRDAVSTFAQRYPACRYTVTCRILAYEDKSYQLGGFAKYELAEFDDEQRQRFVQGWYAELVARERLERGKADILASRLAQSIAERADLRRLAGNPLLLTIMALVNTHKTALPEGRAQLYEEVVEMLLWRWEAVKLEQNEGVTLRQLLQQVGRTDKELQQALAQVALLVHQQIGAGDDREKVADVSRQQLYDALAPLSGDHGWAQQVVEVMQARAGLLVERLPHLFTFPHRTFQEYLAGVALATSHNAEGQPDFPHRALPLADQAQWRTIILLAVGYLIYVRPEPYRVLGLLAELCPEQPRQSEAGWRQVWLAGEVVLEMKPQRMQDTEQGRTLLLRIRQRLAQLLEGGHLPTRERMEAGMVLGQLGDPREGVGVRDDGLPDLAWGGVVSAGTYAIGGDDKASRSLKAMEITIEQPYQLAKYPITNAQFQCFVEAADFGNAEWWAGMPEEDRAIEPNPSWPYANHPRVEVTWYEAVAFCRWLSDKLGYEVRLPHEYEWEVAARYDDGRLYPWGDEFDKDKANMGEGGLRQTTAVGLYPTGRQPTLDLSDMSGNVWEWCQNKTDDPTQMKVDESGDTRGLRGGSWLFKVGDARAAYRRYNHPSFRGSDFGLRLVRVPRPPSLLGH